MYGMYAIVEVCPVKDTLTMHVGPKRVNKWFIPATFFVLFFIIVIVAKVTGNWTTAITYDEFMELIPYLEYIGH
jgi:hypothetical protein